MIMNAEKPRVATQGKAIVERSGIGSGLLVMMPDGTINAATINAATSELRALRLINAWFKKNADNDAINVGTIEWRHGLQPPKEK